jgi:hypothetical protein
VPHYFIKYAQFQIAPLSNVNIGLIRVGQLAYQGFPDSVYFFLKPLIVQESLCAFCFVHINPRGKVIGAENPPNRPVPNGATVANGLYTLVGAIWNIAGIWYPLTPRP